jgi:MFS family permease
MKASQIHRTRLIGFLAAGAGIILFYLLGWRVSFIDLSEVTRVSLSIPLIFNLFLILGIRNVVNVPSALEANWIFQLTEKKSFRHYVSGLRKGILFLNILPVSILFMVAFSLLWDATTAFYFFVYILGISILFMEAFFARFHKIPFACSYMPGKEKFHIYLGPYIIGFVLYYFLTTSLAAVLLQNPLYLAVFWTGILVSVLGIRLYQNLFYYPRTPIIYEEKIEPVMVTLDSSF